jgi:hypothetical protein
MAAQDLESCRLNIQQEHAIVSAGRQEPSVGQVIHQVDWVSQESDNIRPIDATRDLPCSSIDQLQSLLSSGGHHHQGQGIPVWGELHQAAGRTSQRHAVLRLAGDGIAHGNAHWPALAFPCGCQSSTEATRALSGEKATEEKCRSGSWSSPRLFRSHSGCAASGSDEMPQTAMHSPVTAAAKRPSDEMSKRGLAKHPFTPTFSVAFDIQVAVSQNSIWPCRGSLYGAPPPSSRTQPNALSNVLPSGRYQRPPQLCPNDGKRRIGTS